MLSRACDLGSEKASQKRLDLGRILKAQQEVGRKEERMCNGGGHSRKKDRRSKGQREILSGCFLEMPFN